MVFYLPPGTFGFLIYKIGQEDLFHKVFLKNKQHDKYKALSIEADPQEVLNKR